MRVRRLNSLIILLALFAFLASEARGTPEPRVSPTTDAVGKGASARPQMETYKDLIEKARNLTLQRDRIQASQVLIRGLRKEARASAGYKEMVKALDELSGLFYTEKGQTLFSLAESLVTQKPREAVENYQAALRVEDGNVSVLKALARVHLLLAECDLAGAVAEQAETFNPTSAEVRLLKLQVADCAGHGEKVSELLALVDVETAPVDRFLQSMKIKDGLRKRDMKKARALINSWEAAQPEYPEVHFWKWKVSVSAGATDRAAAAKYVQLCQSLSPRAKKSYSLDVELCKQREVVEEFLKGAGDE
ncbi:MAG: hypothetical protein NDI61_09940 [Bdellovibrionaceae bacterium]|nr:hypothetical protein [Pseudobdellovibrionaceae bacterium]